MRRMNRLLVAMVLATVAVPLLPFLVMGGRLDRVVSAWLDPPPSAPVVAALEVAVLAADLLLPVPSSMVATLGGARLGVLAGTACGWLGMTMGAVAGWWLGRLAGVRALDRLEPRERRVLEQGQTRLGPLLVVLTRPLPLLAEAAALAAGAAGMRLRAFLPAAAAANLAVAGAWSIAGAFGGRAESLQWAIIWSLVLPVAGAWIVAGRSLQTPRADV